MSGQSVPVFALSLSLGAALYASLAHEPGLAVLASAFAGMLAALLVIRRIGVVVPLARLGIIILVGLSGGALAGKLATLRVSHPVIAQPIGPVMLEGWIDEVEPARRGVRLRLQVHAIAGLAPQLQPEHVRVTHTTRLAVDAGRFVRCWAVLRPPPQPSIPGDYNFARQAYYEGLGAVGYVQGRCRGGTLGRPDDVARQAVLWIAELRRRLAHHVAAAAGPRAGGFAAALASGDRSFMAAEDQEALRASGLAHLLAISGLHMGIVGGLVFLMSWRGLALIEPLALRIPVQKPAAVLALGVSLAYLLLSGASVSTQRAFIMAAVLYGAVLVDRVALSLRSLAIAMIIVVLMSPWSVLTPGFQMSFAATGALIAAYESWQRRQRAAGGAPRTGVGFWLKSLFVTSFVSGIATMPFALYHFDRLAGLGLFANLLAMPVVSLVSAPLAGAALVLSPFGLSELPLRLFGLSLELVLAIAHVFSSLLPGVSTLGRPMPALALAGFTAALAGAILLVGWRRRAAVAGVCSLFAAASWLTAPVASVHWAPSGDLFLVAGNGHVTRLAVLDGDGLGPLRYSSIPSTELCSAQACAYTLAGHAISIERGASPGLCAQFEGTPTIQTHDPYAPVAPPSNRQGHMKTDTCHGIRVSWPEVEAAGGLSWRVTPTGLVAIAKPACGVRPWAPCLGPAR